MAGKSTLARIRLVAWTLVLLALAATLWFAVIAPRFDRSIQSTLGRGDYRLETTDGGAFSEASLPGAPSAVVFGYAHCPDVCPTTLLEMAAVMKNLGEDARRVQPLFVTVDPERDSLAVLKSYVSSFDGRILGLGGSPELVRKVADNFKVRFEKVRDPAAAPGHYVVDHTAGMYLLGPDGRFLAKFPYAMPVDELTRRLGDYLKASPAPATAGN